MMKYLLLIGIVMLVLWLARSARPTVPRQDGKSRRAGDAPVPMVSCAHCGLHLPESEALPGRGGHYCCEEHRREAKG